MMPHRAKLKPMLVRAFLRGALACSLPPSPPFGQRTTRVSLPLFAIAFYGDKRADAGRSIIANPYIYALSMAVYATSWTYYGSVGRAAASGVGFLPIYIGPTLMAALWWLVLRKMIRISKANRITSIADFIASRYGKSSLLAGIVTVIAVVGIVPYIALQLKAVSNSFVILLQYPEIVMPAKARAVAVWQGPAL